MNGSASSPSGESSNKRGNGANEIERHEAEAGVNGQSNNNDQHADEVPENEWDLKLMQLQTQINKLKRSKARREQKLEELERQLKEDAQLDENISEVYDGPNKFQAHSVAKGSFLDRKSEGYSEHDDDITNSDRMGEHKVKFEHHYLPYDSYTFFAVTKYFNGYTPTRAFALATVVLIMQLVALIIFISDVFDYQNKEILISVPPGVGLPVRLSQLLALLISSWNQDEIRTSFNVMQLGYDAKRVRMISPSASRSKWYLSIFLRICSGCLSLAATFALIINSSTVRDVMLDFAAVTFVSEIDNGAFLLSHWKYMGAEVHELTMKTKRISVKKTSLDDKSKRLVRVPRLASMAIIISVMCGVWAWITIRQSSGYYMDDTIFVQFSDDFSPVMAAFSGLYSIKVDGAFDGMRVTYVEQRSEKLEAESAVFFYCIQESAWMFQYGENPHQDDGFFSNCWYKARSAKTENLDITQASGVKWYSLDNEMSLEMPLQHFYVAGQNNYYGQSCESDGDCGGMLICGEDENNKNRKSCICREGYFGRKCEFLNPCQSLEIDPRDLEGFIGTRTWSRTYTSVQESGKKSPIQVYGKPVFFGDTLQEGNVDVMMFNGRRWILTDSAHIAEAPSTLSSENSMRNLAEFLANNFHAYWSNYTFYFASEPVDVGTPKDSATPVGLQWFRFEASGAEGVSLQSGLQKKTSIDLNLFCAVCDDATNPCFYGATCQEDGSCSCTTGSSGKLCQIPPAGNGLCDTFFNTPEFSFDGGDCCEETCTSTDQYSCGNGMIENDAGVSAYGFVGYPNCEDPRFLKLHGSATFYQIIERGSVRCGSGLYPGFLEFAGGVYSGFEADLCRAIAAAALGDPEAFEIFETGAGDRFRDLAQGQFDVLIRRTTHTAERDIYQSSARVGLSFAPIPTFYDGLRYGGIPPYSECADNLDYQSNDCLNLRICVAQGTSWFEATKNLFPTSMVVGVETGQAEVDGLEAGICNVIAGEISLVAEYIVRGRGFTGPIYHLGEKIYSKEPLSAVTRQDDSVWVKFVSWVFEALIQAEESGITQSTAEYLAPTDVFGQQFRNMFKNAVAANGNYGEIYEKNFGNKIPRTGLNNINQGNNGLIYAFPFGSIETRGQDPIVGGEIEAIRRRGTLNCGIKASPGFAEFDPETGNWRGFEVDFCQGIAAALFSGSPNVIFIPLASNQRFQALAEGVVDVLAAATTHTLTRDVKEKITGKSFDFTPAIFHDGMGFGGRYPFVSCAENIIVDNSTISTKCANSTRICVPDGTTWLEAMRGPLRMPEVNILVVTSQDEAYEKLVLGHCNVIAGESSDLTEQAVRGKGYPADLNYFTSSRRYTKEPLAIVSRSDDTQFSDFLRWVVFGFFHAAEQGITRSDSHAMPSTSLLFGDVLAGMWRHAIEDVGNYNEIFERNFVGILEQDGLNTLNNANGPQFFAKPGVIVNY